MQSQLQYTEHFPSLTQHQEKEPKIQKKEEKKYKIKNPPEEECKIQSPKQVQCKTQNPPADNQQLKKAPAQSKKKTYQQKQKQKQKQKQLKQQIDVIPNIDPIDELQLNDLIKSIKESNVSNFKFHLLNFRLSDDIKQTLKNLLKKYLKSMKNNFQQFLKKVVFLFEHQYSTSQTIKQKLDIIRQQFRQAFKRNYALNQNNNQLILSKLKSISNQQVYIYLDFWGKQFVQKNQKIVDDLAYWLLYSDEKHQRYDGVKILCNVSGVQLPDIQYTAKLLLQFVKKINVYSLDLMLYGYGENLKQLINQVRNVKNKCTRTQKMINYMKTCEKQGFMIKGKFVKPIKSAQQAIMSGLTYQLREYNIDVFQDKFKQKVQYHVDMAKLLFRENKVYFMYFTEKYNLTEHNQIKKWYDQYYSSDIDHKAKLYKNNIYHLDDFKPTQNAIYPGQGEAIEYLSFSHFGVKEQDVVFIGNIDLSFEEADLTLSKADIIAFDIQLSGGMCRQDQQVVEILQIATPTKVYIFDVPKLRGNKQLSNLLTKLFCNINDQIVLGFAYQGNDQKYLRSIIQDSKNIKFKQVIDLQKKNPFSKGIGLKKLVQKVFQKSLSKFEQCSGWNNRPLRKAQLHYAALDSYVLIQIYKKVPLQTEQKIQEKCEEQTQQQKEVKLQEQTEEEETQINALEEQ